MICFLFGTPKQALNKRDKTVLLILCTLGGFIFGAGMGWIVWYSKGSRIPSSMCVFLAAGGVIGAIVGFGAGLGMLK